MDESNSSAPYPKKAIVTMNLTGQLENELSLSVNMEVDILEEVDSFWYRGKCNEKYGIFPKLAVKVLPVAESHNILCYSTALNNSPLYDEVYEPSDGNIAGFISKIHPFYLSIFPYKGINNNYLSFEKKEIIHLIEHCDSIWAKGEINGILGLFPKAFVAIFEDCVEENIQKYSNTLNISCGIPFPYNIYGTAIYDFNGHSIEDLSVKKGEILHMIRQLNCEWVQVENLFHKVGFLPCSFISILEGNSLLRENKFMYSKDKQNLEMNACYVKADARVSQYKELLENDRSVINYLMEKNLNEFLPFTETLQSNAILKHKENTPNINQIKNSIQSSLVTFNKKVLMPHRPAPPIPNLSLSKTNKNLDSAIAIQAIQELLDTEIIFYNDMKSIIEVFSLEDPMWLIKKGINVTLLFGNIIEIRDVAEKLINYLQTRNKSLECFLSLSVFLEQAYLQYCLNHDKVPALINKYMKIPEIWTTLCVGLESMKSNVVFFDLGSLLIKPVQRILRYPLFLNQIYKHLSASNPDRTMCYKALQFMLSLASKINENKRQKEIISKYREESKVTISKKITRLSIHSFAKKSSRMSVRLSSGLGIFALKTKDDAFDRIDEQFQSLYFLLKQFLQNVQDFKLSLDNLWSIVLYLIYGFDVLVENKIAYNVFQRAHITFFAKHKVQLKCNLENKVIQPSSQLLNLLATPQHLIEKRNDKLLDYNIYASRLEKNPDQNKLKEQYQDASCVYTALNVQLLQELPLLCDFLIKIIFNLLISFLRELSNFVMQCFKDISERDMILITGKSMSQNTLNFLKDSKLSLANSEMVSQKTKLLCKYSLNCLYTVVTNVTRKQEFDLSVTRGSIVAVIKKMDPMGSSLRWFADDGGFIPSYALKQITVNEDEYQENIYEEIIYNVYNNCDQYTQ